VAGDCEALIDIRYLPSQSKESIMKDLGEMARKAKMADKTVDISLEIMNHHNPAQSPNNLQLAKLFQDCTEEITGFRPEIVGLGGHTFAGLLMEKGFNAIGVGLGDDVAHQADEYTSIDELVAFTKIMNLACKRLMNT
jgi:acetylornithine deacetylase/succinyl-diaminopimelate desuccinylase-like protein